MARVLIYGGSGYIFVGQWLRVSQAVSGFGGLSLGPVAGVAAVWLLVKALLRARQRER